MLFNSLDFIVFFSVVYSLYLILTHRYQNYWLLLASYFFYGWWNWHYVFLLLFSTTVDYRFGLAIGNASSVRRRQAILVTSLTMNLGLLFLFKYFNFFEATTARMLAIAHMQAPTTFLNVVLPIGISFYTFHNISYIVDVYRGVVKPTRSFVDFALFVAYFPQLVAGPIARPSHLLPQMSNPRPISQQMLRDGFWLILLGYYKKLVLADNMKPYVDRVFQSPADAHGLTVLCGIYAFALQIYGDFAGYTDIARGLGKLMGIELALNFNHPYFAVNPADFWRRWHISLSTWLRDYLYIPLGGNRRGRARTYANLLATMLLGGLWHGAAWHFVAWGAYHGVLLAVHRACRDRLAQWRSSLPLSDKVVHTASMIIMFHLTCFGWLLFAVGHLRDVPLLLMNMVKSGADSHIMVGAATIILFGAPILVLEWWEERVGQTLIVSTWPRPLRYGCYLATATIIMLCAAVDRNAFIYFQF